MLGWVQKAGCFHFVFIVLVRLFKLRYLLTFTVCDMHTKTKSLYRHKYVWFVFVCRNDKCGDTAVGAIPEGERVRLGERNKSDKKDKRINRTDKDVEGVRV